MEVSVNNIEIYDTTLRDGAQREGISFSVADKIQIVKLLDEMGIDYIEGGWPGSNPKDMEFFNRIHEISLQNIKIAALAAPSCTLRCSSDEI